MARDIDRRLRQLRARRGGTDRLGRLSSDAATEVLRKSAIEEGWQKRASSKPYTRYALGAMQEVDAEYTRVGIETAERVGNQLHKELGAVGIPVEFRLQGSVPLNVHIRGVSDVDLLTLETSFLIFDSSGRVAQSSGYTSAGSRTSLTVLQNLRMQSEKVLVAKFPAATVDTKGGKAIAVSGGSLARPVDVVPSHWYDTVAYQVSKKRARPGRVHTGQECPRDDRQFSLSAHISDRGKRSRGGRRC